MNYLEVNNWLKLAKEGDKNAELKILSELKPLIKSSIKKYCPIKYYYDDLYQDGILVILNCIKTYKSEKSQFLNYVKNYLKYYYLDTFKYLIRDEKNIEKIVDYEAEDSNEIEKIESPINIEEEFEEEEEIAYLKNALNMLSKRQREVVYLFYFENLTLDEIAQKLNIRRWTVINTKRRAIEILKEVI